jgi:hypothetical protein
MHKVGYLSMRKQDGYYIVSSLQKILLEKDKLYIGRKGHVTCLTTEDILDVNKENTMGIEILLKGKSIKLYAANTQVRDEWIECLNAFIGKQEREYRKKLFCPNFFDVKFVAL